MNRNVNHSIREINAESIVRCDKCHTIRRPVSLVKIVDDAGILLCKGCEAGILAVVDYLTFAGFRLLPPLTPPREGIDFDTGEIKSSLGTDDLES